MRETLWVFAYDIRRNRLRTRVSEALEAVGGQRVNLSVFEVWATRSQADALEAQIRDHLQPRDKLIRYRVCASCRTAASGRDESMIGPRVID